MGVVIPTPSASKTENSRTVISDAPSYQSGISLPAHWACEGSKISTVIGLPTPDSGTSIVAVDVVFRVQEVTRSAIADQALGGEGLATGVGAKRTTDIEEESRMRTRSATGRAVIHDQLEASRGHLLTESIVRGAQGYRLVVFPLWRGDRSLRC